MNLKKTSVKISYLLRHNPEGLKIDKEGWVEIAPLISKLKIDIDTLNKIVSEDNKQRYSIDANKLKIRANQGHSIDVDIKFKEQVPPTMLYHGTSPDNLDKIKKNGLCKMSRKYVHLSADKDTAIIVGKRHSKHKEPVILSIDCKKMLLDKIPFYISENKVWLVDHVDPKYILDFERQNYE